MNASNIFLSLKRRTLKPLTFFVFFFFVLAYLGSYWPSRPLGLIVFVIWVAIPVILMSTFVIVGPIPWQWDDTPHGYPSFLRGLVQSIVVVEACVLLAVLLDVSLRISKGFSPNIASALRMNCLLWAPLIMVFGFFIANREREATEKLIAKDEAREAQTRLLQSQLHPHVLFNALNGILELLHKDVLAAETCVRNMADLLRRLLDASEQTFFRLDQERQLVEHYLAIESMRLGSRLRVAWEWADTLNGRLVPPLLLQPLVENAIKHGIAPNVEGGEIRIRLLVEGGLLRLEVWNTGCLPSDGTRRGAVGVKNLKARLALAFGAEGRYQLERQGEWTQASVTLPVAKIGT